MAKEILLASMPPVQLLGASSIIDTLVNVET
jgi:hypothetical protein